MTETNDDPVHVVVLAAGQGTRMRSFLPKVLHKVAGKPMIEHVLACSFALEPETTTLVVGHMAESVRVALAAHTGLGFVLQQPQIGTAHALLQAEPALAGRTGTLVLLSGDVPLLRAETLAHLVDAHRGGGAAATVVTAVVERPYGYGRVVRSGDQIIRIVEERDASPAERQIREINSGIYAFDLEPLFDALRGIAAGNAQGEYYLTDLIGIYRRKRLAVQTVLVEDPAEVRGVNSRTELAEVGAIMMQKKNEELMAAGVTLIDPATTYVDPDVQVGADTVIHPGVVLQGQTRIGAACEIHAYVRIVDTEIEDRVLVQNFCLLVGAHIAEGASVGPFAHLRPGSKIGRSAKVGNFVELKNTTLGPGSKASHLSYLGDATIGAKVNIGAGTIVCNYDGRRKQQTVIEDEAFIGSDTQLVAPVTVGRGAYVGTGTTVREDVPAGALAVSAGKQRNIDGWADRRKDAAPQATDGRRESPETES